MIAVWNMFVIFLNVRNNLYQDGRYLLENRIRMHNRLPVSYKVKKKHVKYAIKKLKENEQITMNELAKIVKKKYDYFDITPRQLRNVIRGLKLNSYINRLKK